MPKKVKSFDYLVAFESRYIKEVNTIESKMEEDDDSIILQSKNNNPEISYILKESFNSLSDESKQIISFLLDAPEELLEVLSSKKIKKLSIPKFRKLITSSWGIKKTRIISWEMKNFLKEIKNLKLL